MLEEAVSSVVGTLSGGAPCSRSAPSRRPRPSAIVHPAPSTKAVPAVASTACPVERLAREHEVLNKLHNECDRAQSKLFDSDKTEDISRRSWAKSLGDEAIDREFAIRSEVSFHQAKSLPGALFQLAIGTYQLETLSEEAIVLTETEDATADDRITTKQDVERLTKTAQRNLHSAARYLRSLCSEADVAAIGTDNFVHGVGRDRNVISTIVADRLAGNTTRTVISVVDDILASFETK